MSLRCLRLEHWLTGLAIVLVAAWLLHRANSETKFAAAASGGGAVIAWIKRGEPKDSAAAAGDVVAGIESIVQAIVAAASVPAGLVPYIDPIRASDRTGQIVHQFVAVNGQGVPVDQLVKFLADMAAKAAGVPDSADATTAIENCASSVVSTGLGIYSTIKTVEAAKKLASDPKALKEHYQKQIVELDKQITALPPKQAA